ncbi:class I SAM-dependent DNA methyltransferase [Sciscionella marina]|uniref:class I SAM-dependent DNA methyltransferase n=1 Tax=Sciscionella marina TaxID=508770 RepID=UPI00039D8EE1|nr:class I SAM-dependent methyltransferase [Sciscionella marina]
MTSAYEAELAEIYDQVYRGRGKDYSAEAEALLDTVRARLPHAESALDIACGTGSHLPYLIEAFGSVEGVDLSTHMLAIAEPRFPGVRFHNADMVELDLGRRYDVLTCLFASIAYLRTTEELDETVRRMAGHLNPGGLLLIEPWWFPEKFRPGMLVSDVFTVDGRTIARVSHSTRSEDSCILEIHFLVADNKTGIRHFVSEHRLALFTREQFRTAFEGAGLKLESIENTHYPRGLLLGTFDGSTQVDAGNV